MTDETTLPQKLELVPFELNVPTTNVTRQTIQELQEKYKNLPDVSEDGGLDKLRKGRKEVKDVRIAAKAYCEEIKSSIQDIKKTIDDAYIEEVDKPIREMETRFDKIIKEEEQRLKDIKEEKKRKVREKNLEIDKVIEEIKDISHHKIVSVTVEDIDNNIKQLQDQTPDKEYFDDRFDEVKFAFELTIEKLQQLRKDTVRRDEEKAELKKREDALIEEKRVNGIKDKIKDLDRYLVDAVKAKGLMYLEDVYEAFCEVKITKVIYEEFFEIACFKRLEVNDQIEELINNMKLKVKQEKEAEVEKELIEKEKIDLKKKEDDLKAKNDLLEKEKAKLKHDSYQELMKRIDRGEVKAHKIFCGKCSKYFEPRAEFFSHPCATMHDMIDQKINIPEITHENIFETIVEPSDLMPRSKNPVTLAPPPEGLKITKLSIGPEVETDDLTAVQDCHEYLVKIFDKTIADTFIDHLEAGKIPHLKAPWF